MPPFFSACNQSNSVAVLAASGNSNHQNFLGAFTSFNNALACHPKLANFCYAKEFCCGVPQALYSTSTSSFQLLEAISFSNACFCLRYPFAVFSLAFLELFAVAVAYKTAPSSHLLWYKKTDIPQFKCLLMMIFHVIFFPGISNWWL